MRTETARKTDLACVANSDPISPNLTYIFIDRSSSVPFLFPFNTRANVKTAARYPPAAFSVRSKIASRFHFDGNRQVSASVAKERVVGTGNGRRELRSSGAQTRSVMRACRNWKLIGFALFARVCIPPSRIYRHFAGERANERTFVHSRSDKSKRPGTISPSRRQPAIFGVFSV